MEHKKNNPDDHKALARIIALHVPSFNEVNFNSSLVKQVASEWRKKPDRKLRSKLQSIWNSCDILRREVETLLSDKDIELSSRQGDAEKITDDDCKELLSNSPILHDAGRHTIDVHIDACDNCMSCDFIEESILVSEIDRSIDVGNNDTNPLKESETVQLLGAATDDSSSNDSASVHLTKSSFPKTYAIYKTREKPNASFATQSIYDFSDSEEEYEVNKENISPNVPSQTTLNVKYVVDLGEKRPYSAKFKDNDGLVTTSTIRQGLRTVMAEDYGVTCSLRFRTIRTNESDYTVYAKCMSVEHTQHFKFVITSLHLLNALVFASSSDKISYQHKIRNFTQLRGAERERVKAALTTQQPRDYQMQVARSIDPNLAADGNMQDLRRLYIYQKAKSEDNCKNDLALKSGDLNDLFQLWMVQNKAKDPYLRYVSLPLTTMMFTEAQLNMLEYSEGTVLHLDATGSVVRKPALLDCKRIYYYAIVTKHKESVIPIAEMVTSVHNINSISTFLKAYKFFVQEKTKNWPFVAAVVVDWSWALLNSLFSEWNQMSIGDYLNIAYSYVTKGQRPRNVIIIQTCCAHFMKRISTIIKKDFSQYESAKSYLLECVAIMMLCRAMDELEFVFVHFVRVVSAPDKKDAQSSLRALGQIVTDRQSDITDIMNDNTDKDDGEEAKSKDVNPQDDVVLQKRSKAIFANSPFFTHFEEKLKETEKEIDQTKPITNKCYVPGFARHMTWRHLPFAPLWTSIMLDLVDKNISRLSNAYVESYHRVIKHQVLKHEKNLKIGHFIRKTESYTRSLIAEANLEVPLKTKDISKKPKYPVTLRTKTVSIYTRSGKSVVHASLSEDNDETAQPDTSLSKISEPKDAEFTCPDEASDPMIRETWVDKKKTVRAKGHFKGSSLKRMVDEINTKKTEVITATVEATEANVESEQNALDNDDIGSCNFPVDGSYSIGNSEYTEFGSVMKNGLINNIDYYMQSRSHNLKIACFTAAKNPPIRSNCFWITARQFHTLTPNRWIDGLVIDCFTMTHIEAWTNCVYMSTDDTGAVIGSNWSYRKQPSCSVYNISHPLSGRLFMPYMIYGHWRLLVVDIDEKSLCLLDPYGTNDDQERLFAAFNQFLNSSSKQSTVNEMRKINWTIKELKDRPYQAPHDTTNCGAYVTYYIQCLSKNEPFNMSFDPVEFRRDIAHTLLEKSTDVKDMCLYCFGQRHGNDFTACVSCHRWCHIDCIDRGVCGSEEEEFEGDPLIRFKRRSKKTTAGFKKQKTNISTVSHGMYTCKLCERNKNNI